MNNAIPIAVDLTNKKKVKVMLHGGTLLNEHDYLVGQGAEEVIRNYYFDKFFHGEAGNDIELGLTTPNPMEAQLNRLMVERASEVIAVTDSSKFGRQSFSFICELEVISTIITDTKLSEEYEKKLLKQDINVIKV